MERKLCKQTVEKNCVFNIHCSVLCFVIFFLSLAVEGQMTGQEVLNCG